MVWQVQFLSADYEENTGEKYIHSYRLECLIVENTDAEKNDGVDYQESQ